MVHYLDNAATTPMRDVAVAAMMPILQQDYGNPSGAHRMSRQANRIVDESREQIADTIGFLPGELVFTSGGTEADNTIIRGAIDAQSRGPLNAGPVAICSAIEHHAVLEPVLALGGRTVGVDSTGQVDLVELEDLLQSIADDPQQEPPAVVSVMAANNETGVIQPLSAIAGLVRSHAPEAILHCDAVQAMCWLDLPSVAADFDSISLSAHKFGGPKGVGILALRSTASGIAPLLLGGSQERSRRGGTHNVAGIAAMAAAAVATVAERDGAIVRVEAMRDRLSDGILNGIDGARETGVAMPDGERNHKLVNISHFCFERVESEALLVLLEKHDIMASAASSCASGAAEPSHVLTAMGYDRSLAFGSLRLSLGYTSSDDDVDAVLACLPPAVERLRERG